MAPWFLPASISSDGHHAEQRRTVSPPLMELARTFLSADTGRCPVGRAVLLPGSSKKGTEIKGAPKGGRCSTERAAERGSDGKAGGQRMGTSYQAPSTLSLLLLQHQPQRPRTNHGPSPRSHSSSEKRVSTGLKEGSLALVLRLQVGHHRDTACPTSKVSPNPSYFKSGDSLGTTLIVYPKLLHQLFLGAHEPVRRAVRCPGSFHPGECKLCRWRRVLGPEATVRV